MEKKLTDYYYPSILLDCLQKKIYEKKEYYKYKQLQLEKDLDYNQLRNIRDLYCRGSINIQKHQLIVSNLINPNTPYKGLIVYHGTGAGKTCLALSVAETFKTQVLKYQTRIHIIVPGPDIRNQWIKELTEVCFKHIYMKIPNNKVYSELNKSEIKTMKKNALLLFRQYYKILTYEKFKKQVLGEKIIDKKTKKYIKNTDGTFLDKNY